MKINNLHRYLFGLIDDMNINELLEGALEPNLLNFAIVKKVLDSAIEEFERYMKGEDDDPDPDVLADFLNRASSKHEVPEELIWKVVPEGTEGPSNLYIHGAAADPLKIEVALYPEDFEKYGWDKNNFLKSARSVLTHELIHWNQYSRMDPRYLLRSKSGWQKAQKPGGEIDVKQYIQDKQEIMAHASDLSFEMSLADDPGLVLRDPEGFLKYLPTWSKYRQAGFLRKDPVIKRLLKYTAAYMKQRGII